MTARRSSSLASTSASSRYSATRPTWASQTWASSRVAGQVDGHPDPVDQLEGHAVRVEHRVALLLPAVGVEVLAEVAEAVHQTDADQGDAQAAGGLQVVAGQHAQAAGVLGEGLGDTELGREVGDAPQRADRPVLEPPRGARGSGAGRRASRPGTP